MAKFKKGDKVVFRGECPEVHGIVKSISDTETANGRETVYIVQWADNVDNGPYFAETLIKVS